MNVRVHDRDGVAVAQVEGEIDLGNAGGLAEALVSAVSNATLGLIVDLSATSYLDSAALRVLLDLQQRLSLRQQELRLVVPSSAVIRRVFEVARMNLSIPVDDSLEESLSRVPR